MSYLMLSYPRCGSNFLWYSIKEITGINFGKSHAQNKEFWTSEQHFLDFYDIT